MKHKKTKDCFLRLISILDKDEIVALPICFSHYGGVYLKMTCKIMLV